MAPATDATVVSSAYQRLISGLIIAIGSNTKSGGMGKNTDSQNAINARPNWPYSNMMSTVSGLNTVFSP
jgi:hypothetical protein